MVNEIRMSQEEMNAKASMFDAKGEEFASVVADLGNLASELLEEWHGESSASFNEAFHSYDKTFNDVEELIAGMAQQLRDVAASLTDVDQTIAGRIRGM